MSSLPNVERVSLPVLVSQVEADHAADFQAKNVEQDLNRLLDESHAGAALRSSITSIYRGRKLIYSRIRIETSNVSLKRSPNLPIPPLGSLLDRSTPIIQTRPIAIYETRRFSR